MLVKTTASQSWRIFFETLQLMSGMGVFGHVCGQKADTSINY